MKPTEKNLVLRKAMNNWGWEAQLDVLGEECCELAQSIFKVYNKKASHQQMIEEMADVYIMIQQMLLSSLGPDIRKWEAIKIDRLRGLLDPDFTREIKEETLQLPSGSR